MKKLEIDIPLTSAILKGDLIIPIGATGIVVFSHGISSSRFSTRNRKVAELFQKQKIGTLLLDLLTKEEDSVYENRFNIDLLTSRLIETTEWLVNYSEMNELPICYFGTSTGAASAIRAAAYFGDTIKAVVSLGGRPDLASNALHQVTAPTLLIVGGEDISIIEMNKRAYDELHCEKELKVITGTTQLFEEPGKLFEVADSAIIWYTKYLP